MAPFHHCIKCHFELYGFAVLLIVKIQGVLHGCQPLSIQQDGDTTIVPEKRLGNLQGRNLRHRHDPPTVLITLLYFQRGRRESYTTVIRYKLRNSRHDTNLHNRTIASIILDAG